MKLPAPNFRLWIVPVLLLGCLVVLPPSARSLSGGETPKIITGEKDTYIRIRDLADYHSLNVDRDTDGALLWSGA